MIYLSDDYIEKYIETLCYLLERATSEGYSVNVIEKSIAYSTMINELEKSNITLMAFSSIEKNYKDIFPYKDNYHFVSNIYGIYGWIAECYIRLFLKFQITFETLFIVLPINDMLGIYPLYHEMSFSHIDDLFRDRVTYSYLDCIMKYKNISNNDLSGMTGIPFSTINALRYGKRDIGKLESQALLKLSQALAVKMESLLPTIDLKTK